MSQANVNVGTAPGAGNGDTLYNAFTKINTNFTELYSTITSSGVTYANIAPSVDSSASGSGLTLNITKYANIYGVSVNLPGTSYALGETVRIWGNVVGGTYTTHDLVVEVGTLANSSIGSVGTVTFTGTPSRPVLTVAGRTGDVVLTTNDIVGLRSTFSSNADIQSAVDGKIASNIANLIGTAPGVLDTLGEIADALNDDANVYNTLVTTITTANTNMKGYTDNLVTTANVNMKGYVDAEITAIGAHYGNADVLAYLNDNNYATETYVTTANTNVVGYVDNAVTTANLNLKGYVDGEIATVTAEHYGNADVLAYLNDNSYATETYVTTANTNVVGYVDNAVSTANVNLKGYTDDQFTTGNTNVVGYVDGEVTTLNSTITTANTNVVGYTDNAVSTANVNLKGYTDNKFGAFTLNSATNLIQTSNGAANISVSINGADANDPPAFIMRKWSFNIDGTISFNDTFLGAPLANGIISTTKIGQWGEAYGWGNHGSAGYATSSALTTANVNMKGYVDSEINDTVVATGSSIAEANVNMKGYVDGQVTTLNSTITTANTNVVGYVDSAVSTANVNLKGYVDNELTSYATTSALTTANTNVVGYVDGQVTTLNSAITTANVNVVGYIDNEIAGLVDSAPATLDTLNEIAAALGDDPNLATTLTNTISTANVNMQGYVDGQVTTLNSAITTANTNMQGYVDDAVSTANVNLKGYADATFLTSTLASALDVNSQDLRNVDNIISPSGVVTNFLYKNGGTETTHFTITSTGTDFPSGTTVDFTGATVTGLTGLASDVVDDTTPQLGGNLDLNGNYITGTGNIAITGNIIGDNRVTGSLIVDDSIAVENNVTLNGGVIQIEGQTGNISATNINLSGDLDILGDVTSALTIQNNDLTVNNSNVVVVGYVVGDTVTTSTGGVTITGADVTLGGNVTATQNIIGGSLTSTGNVDASGSITGNGLFSLGDVVGTDFYGANFYGGNVTIADATIIFEGATADAFETTLAVTDPTADRTITFPDATGTVALTSDVTTANTNVVGYVDSAVSTANVNLKGYVDGEIATVTGAHYEDSDVNTLLASWGSNTLSTTGNVTVGDAIVDSGVKEAYGALSSATGTVTHDCSNGHVFYHTSISSDFTANFTNLELDTGYVTTLTLVLSQGATAYIASAVQIEGVAQTIKWQGNVIPTGTDNGIDAMSFSVINSSGTYTVLGQLVDFGG